MVLSYLVIFSVFFFSSSSGSEGPGQILIQTVKLAFSVTNNVIRLKPPSDVVSPLEQALTQHGGHGNNLIVVLAKYIYHKHDPALPRLAIQLLKRLATVCDFLYMHTADVSAHISIVVSVCVCEERCLTFSLCFRL